MSAKITLLVSAFLTASILTVTGGILTKTGAIGNAQATSAAQSAGVQQTQIANYQQLLAQANQTIVQANAEITSLRSQLQQGTVAPTSQSYAILPDQAARIASNAAGEVVDSVPRLVNYNGSAAYEVSFTAGKVYVDANSGSILYNGVLASRTITAQQAAQIAMQYTGNNSVVGVATGLYNNQKVYEVVFQNNEVIFVDAIGNILAVQLPSSGQATSNSEEND